MSVCDQKGEGKYLLPPPELSSALSGVSNDMHDLTIMWTF